MRINVSGGMLGIVTAPTMPALTTMNGGSLTNSVGERPTKCIARRAQMPEAQNMTDASASDLPNALRLLRLHHDLSQREAAQKLGISPSYLSEIESGTKEPTLGLLNTYALMFNVPASSILFFAENIKVTCQPSPPIAEAITALLTFYRHAKE